MPGRGVSDRAATAKQGAGDLTNVGISVYINVCIMVGKPSLFLTMVAQLVRAAGVQVIEIADMRKNGMDRALQAGGDDWTQRLRGQRQKDSDARKHSESRVVDAIGTATVASKTGAQN